MLTSDTSNASALASKPLRALALETNETVPDLSDDVDVCYRRILQQSSFSSWIAWYGYVHMIDLGSSVNLRLLYIPVIVAFWFIGAMVCRVLTDELGACLISWLCRLSAYLGGA
jgi:hypothetical protein